MVQVFTTPQVIHRLNSFPAEKKGYLYGLPPEPESSESENGYLVLSLSQEESKKEDDASCPYLPTGLDPIGVFIITDTDDSLLDEIEALVSRLPDQFLSVNNPVVFIRRGSEPLQAFISSNLLEPSPLSIRKDFEDILLRVRVRGSLQIMCTADEEDITNSFRHLINKVTCPYGSFRLTNSNVLFLHYWRNGVLSTDQGWTVNSSDFFSTEEDGEEEGVKVTNVKDVESKEVTELWKYVQNQEGADSEESDGDDGDEYIPEALKAKAKKKKNAKKETAGNSKPVKEEEFMDFKLMLNMSGEAYTLKTYNCSPIVREDPTVTKCFKLDLPIDSIGVLRRSTKIPDIITVLKGCVQRQIHMIGTVVLSEFRSFQTLSNPEIYHFKNDELGCHMITTVYTKSLPCNKLGEVRKKIHEEFLLPLNRPLFRRFNEYSSKDVTRKSGPLINPHENIGSPGLGKTYLVHGNYAYHHYMQNGFNDDGWGCAYRSLQTLISWFRLQGYSSTDIPTHAQIQKCLVEIGDKERSFIDSKQWIGSTEVGFVLDTALHVQSKFISVSSGEEMPMKARDLARHFETNGTPVMIGGGVLAHTILGVDWNEDTGEVKWLILDPHYTGSDWKDGKPNLSVINGKGWCAWKGPDFWVKDAFYNMCLPIRPNQW